jgi:hypothetical protein
MWNWAKLGKSQITGLKEKRIERNHNGLEFTIENRHGVKEVGLKTLHLIVRPRTGQTLEDKRP